MTDPENPAANLISQIGGTDVYLLDQILKNRFPSGTTILDAGCGGGRNVRWFLQNGYNVSAVDGSQHSVASVQQLAGGIAPQLPMQNFRAEPVERMSFSDASFDAVLSIAVLHFARDDWHFESMIREMWRVLKTGGFLFARLSSNIGFENQVQPLGNGRYAIPDGSERYLVNLEMLKSLTATLRGRLLEPIKTVNVQNMRCMTTWVVGK